MRGVQHHQPCVFFVRERNEKKGEREKALQVGRGLVWVGVTSMGDEQKFTSYSCLFPFHESRV